jgi:metal-responsive CopG/Arc/MetJ family transcriptional regulator
MGNETRGKGRPRLDLEAVLVRLPQGTCARIDELVGKNKRSEFVRELIERELARREGVTAGHDSRD